MLGKITFVLYREVRGITKSSVLRCYPSSTDESITGTGVISTEDSGQMNLYQLIEDYRVDYNAMLQNSIVAHAGSSTNTDGTYKVNGDIMTYIRLHNDNPIFAVEEVKINPDGTRVVKYYKQFPDGNVSKLKTSTLFPHNWSDNEIIDAIQNIGDSGAIGIRPLTGETLHRGSINGVEIDVIKQRNDIISGYPVGEMPTPGFDAIN